MAKKIAKPAPKPAPKPAAKPVPKPAEKNLKPRAVPFQTPQPAPLDLVRNPNFDAAMAQQNYANLMRDQQARIGAELGLGGAPLPQSEIDKKYIDDGRGGRILNPIDAAKVKSQFDQLRANIAANPNPARNFDIDYIEGGQRYAPVNQGPQAGGGMGGQGNFPADVAQSQYIDPQSPEGQAMEKKRQMARDALSRYNPNMPSLMPIQTPKSDALNQDLANRGMGGGIPTPIPQGQQGAMAPQYQNPQGQQQQMQSYQNFLNQGMNNMASVNQGAAANFANTQPGMQAPQAGIGQTKGPNMPSIGMQQRRPNPPRKFSTISNRPARFA